MKIITGPESIQGSDEWKTWRRNMITATDAGIILGVNPFKSPYKLWKEKLELDSPEEQNERMLEGQRLEPIARDLFIKETAINVAPAICVHSQCDWIGASIDGLSEDNLISVEIKCSKKIYEQACNDFIEPYYIAQMQHQLNVLDHQCMFFFAYWDGNFILKQIIRDVDYISGLIEKEKEFYQCLKNLTPPELTDKDYVIREDEEWNLWATNLRIAKSMKEEYEKKEQQSREKLIELAGQFNCKGSGLKLSKVVSKGNVDYKKMINELKIDPEPFRGQKRETWRVTIDGQV